MPNLFVVDLVGTDISEQEERILKHPNVGALILFSRNATDEEQLKRLIAKAREIRPDIMIVTDHEGGKVQRFRSEQGFSILPPARDYGEKFDLNQDDGCKFAEQGGELMAQELLNYGIDLSLAPVLDLHGISSIIAGKDRAFHSNPDAVIALTTAFIKGMNKVGMPAVGKHFPGHGSVASDSHVSKPVLDTSMEILLETDLKPFIELINRKLLAAIMPAHVTYTQVDPEQPSGFSNIWLQDILRNRLHFEGLIISDCLSMKGANIGDMQTRVTQALQAGCDMLIVANQTPDLIYQLLEETTFVQTKESADRIAAFKSQMIRFSSEKYEKKDKITPYLSHTLHGRVPTELVNTSEPQEPATLKMKVD